MDDARFEFYCSPLSARSNFFVESSIIFIVQFYTLIDLEIFKKIILSMHKRQFSFFYLLLISQQ